MKTKVVLVMAFVAFFSAFAEAQETTTTEAPPVEEEEDEYEDENAAFHCYTCGLDTQDPNRDQPGSYCESVGDGSNCPSTSKMYNHTCEDMDGFTAPAIKERFSRRCPNITKSCYYIESEYEDKKHKFRGCADVEFAHDEVCSTKKQAVPINNNARSVDVDIKLCYCNSDNCNEIVSAATKFDIATLFALTFIGLLLHSTTA